MASREAPARAHRPPQSADPRARMPQAPAQAGRCAGAAAQLAAVHRTLRHGPLVQLQAGGAARNRTGLPDRLKNGVEALSGVSLDGVKVHYNSSKPAQLEALAYAQGSDIHLAPGQERHLPHEAWHLVQQAQGRVKPTLQMKSGVPVNDDKGLEAEADLMGAKAAAIAPASKPIVAGPAAVMTPSSGSGPVQRYFAASNGVRLSDGNQLALANEKSLWASPSSIDQSNEVLAKKQSFVKLVPTGANMNSLYGGKLHKIEPRWNEATDVKIDERVRLKKANTNVDGFITHSDCFMNAQLVMGVEDTDTGSRDKVSPVFGTGENRKARQPEKVKEQAKFGSYLSSNLPTRSLQLFLNTAMPLFYKSMETVPKESPIRELASAFLKGFTRASFEGFLFAYRTLVTEPKLAPLLDVFSREFGVNEYMTPEIGEGLAVVSDPFLRNKRQEEIKAGKKQEEEELWNYHFAGVIMKDGSDYVILENYSVGQSKVDNQKWTFGMFGTGKQSFHAEMKTKQGIEGGAPLSLSFDQTPDAK
jgi:uncharacterized protein DUF4157